MLLKRPPRNPNDLWYPATDAQYSALESNAEFLMFGGSAGSLKTETLLMDAIQERHNPSLRAIIFRESFPQFTDIIDKSQRLYKMYGGQWRSGKYTWEFPSGATVRLAYFSEDKHIDQYRARYSFQGWDESTLQSFSHIRAAAAWLGSTDGTLFNRIRLATNPGGRSADDHIRIFLHGYCPIHFPDKSCEPGKLYTDRTFSDGKLIPMSCAFIPGNVKDHNLLGAEYIARLRMQEGTLADKLELGCWCALEGAYFSMSRDRLRHIGEVDQQWWHTHFLSIDYGYGKSSAAAGLYMRGAPEVGYPNGRIRKLAESVEPHKEVSRWMREDVIPTFVTPMIGERRRRIQEAFCDPAVDKHIGDGGESVYEMISNELEPFDIPLTKASNNRIGGAQKLLRLLSSGEFEICSNCDKTYRAITSRIHDPKTPGDVLKIKGDPLDDVYDETRYAINSFTSTAEKPAEEKQREEIHRLREAGADNNSIYLRSRQIMAEAQVEEEDDVLSWSPRMSRMRAQRRR